MSQFFASDGQRIGRSFSFSISPYNEYSGLISFRMDWLDLLAVQGTLKSRLQHYSSNRPLGPCAGGAESAEAAHEGWLPLEGSARGQGWAKIKPDGLGAPRGRRAIRHRYLPGRQITNTFLSEGLAATGLWALMPPSCGHSAWRCARQGQGRGSYGVGSMGKRSLGGFSSP